MVNTNYTLSVGTSIVLLFCFMISCGETTTVSPVDTPNSLPPNDGAEMHKQVVKREQRLIDSVVASYAWNMVRSKEGMYYEKQKERGCKNNGEIGEVFLLRWSATNWRGDTLQADTLISLQYLKDLNISGLHLATKYLCPGQETQLIFPRHLGFSREWDPERLGIAEVVFATVEILASQKP